MWAPAPRVWWMFRYFGAEIDIEISYAEFGGDLTAEVIARFGRFRLEAVGEDGVVTVTFDGASPGGAQRARIEVQSLSVAPLTVAKLCLMTGEGDCIEGNRQSESSISAGIN
mgnify:CR=1 FL=1